MKRPSAARIGVVASLYAAVLASATSRAAPTGPAADDLRATLSRMADAELAALGPTPPVDWEAATLYAGMSAVDRATGDGHNARALRTIAAANGWAPYAGKPKLPFFADHICVCQTYLDLYDQSHAPAELQPTREAMDRLVQHLALYKPGQKPTWWWCDALFMAPAVLSHLSAITGDRTYLDAMDVEWWRTTELLYDPKEHLFFRDGTFLSTYKPTTRAATRGVPKPWRAVYWGRGNGWVVAGLARVLSHMPADYPGRPKYIGLFRDMIDRLVALQPADGLWRADLLADPMTATGETSGTGLNVYAIAWGINHGLLDRARYLPAVSRGYAGLRRCIRPDGRVGYGQPHGYKPAPAPADSVTSFGVGAYLLAGSELLPLAGELSK